MPHYAPLPLPDTADGQPRRTGVEIEFAGLTEVAAGQVVAEVLGGTPSDPQAHALVVEGSSLGDIEVELDTVLRKKQGLLEPLLDKGLDLATGLVPVEIITLPLTREALPQLDQLTDALRAAGATGTRDGVLLGFGVHLNTEVVAPDHAHTMNSILAFALLEPWLRRSADLDMTRRLMPFVNPWPKALVTDLVQERPADLAALMRLVARHVDSRNHGLDLFPLFAHAEPDLYHDLFPEPDKTAARPTWHFRLPDCRIDEGDWSLAEAWQLWHAVEILAADEMRLAALAKAWSQHSHSLPGAEARWVKTVEAQMSPQKEAAQ